MTNSLNWEIVNQIKKSPDPFSCDFLNLPNKEFSYLFDLLDTPISSVINKILSSACADEDKTKLLYEYIKIRPQFLYMIPQEKQSREMVLRAAREARSYHGPGKFLDCVNPVYIDKKLKLALIEQGYLNIFVDEWAIENDPDYVTSVFGGLLNFFKYQYFINDELLSSLNKIDYTIFSSDQIHRLTKSSREFFDYIPFDLIPEQAFIDHVNAYKVSSKFRHKVDTNLYRKLLKIELLHNNLPAHPQGLIKLVARIKKPYLVSIVKEFLKTYHVDEVLPLATTDRQLHELAKVFGIESSPRFSELSNRAKRNLIQDDLDI